MVPDAGPVRAGLDGACLVTVSDCTPREDCLLMACDVAVRRALELASKRMLTRGFLLNKGLREVPQYLIYTRLPAVVDEARQTTLLRGAWESLPESMTGVPGLVDALDQYARSLVRTCEQHDPEYLRPIIRRQL